MIEGSLDSVSQINFKVYNFFGIPVLYLEVVLLAVVIYSLVSGIRKGEGKCIFGVGEGPTLVHRQSKALSECICCHASPGRDVQWHWQLVLQ